MIVREITERDVEACCRGMALRRCSIDEIVKIAVSHEPIEQFASQVVVQACRAELRFRGADLRMVADA